MSRAKETQSKVNPDLLVTKDQCVVSLVRQKYHAYILIESLNQGVHTLEWYDFLPKTMSCNIFGLHFNLKSWMNRPVTAKIRYCPGNGSDPLTTLPETKEALFEDYHWNMDTDSWPCAPEKVAAMKADIEHDRELQKKDELKFKFCGHKIPNCTTWTWEKLKVAGIDASNKDSLNKLVIIASHNIGSKRHPRP